MGAPTKETVQYFPLYVNQSDTEKLLITHFGWDGQRFLFGLWRKLASEQGHFFDARKPMRFDLFAGELGLSSDKLREMLDKMSYWGNIDEELWKSGIIWYQGFVDTLLATAYKDRKVKPSIEKVVDYLRETPYKSVFIPEKPRLIGDKPPINPGISVNIEDKPGFTTQIKINETKEKEITSSSKPSSSNAADAADDDFSKSKNGEEAAPLQTDSPPSPAQPEPPKNFFEDWTDEDRQTRSWVPAKNGRRGSYDYELALAFCELERIKNPIRSIGGYLKSLKETWDTDSKQQIAIRDWEKAIMAAYENRRKRWEQEMANHLIKQEQEKEAHQYRLLVNFTSLSQSLKTQVFEKACSELCAVDPLKYQKWKENGDLRIDHPHFPKIAPYIAEQMEFLFKKGGLNGAS